MKLHNIPRLLKVITRKRSGSSSRHIIIGISLLTAIVLIPLIGTRSSVSAVFQDPLDSRQAGDLSTAIRLKQQEAARLVRSEFADQQFREIAKKFVTRGSVRVIVRLKAAFSQQAEMRGMLEARAQRQEITRVRDAVLANLNGYDPGTVRSMEFLPYLSVSVNAAGLESLRASSEVIDIQEDRIYRHALAQSVPFIGGTAAWASGYTGSGQAVAILDTGVEKTHPMLAGKVVSEACYSSNVSNSSTSVCPGGASSSTATDSGLPCPTDCQHGTHVAGIAAGKNGTSGGSTFSGVAKDASIIAIQVFSQFNNDSDCGGAGSAPCVAAYTSDIISGLQRVYSLRNTYSIASANLSLGGGSYTSNCDSADAATKAVIDLLRSANIATVIASGNEATKNAISSPGCISTAISVGATLDTSNTVAGYSNSASFLNLLAPGSGITSSVPGGSYATWNGTSMATPHVTGTWAVMKQKLPTATVTEILNALTSTGVSVTDTNSIAKPRIQIDAALANIGVVTPPSAPTSLTATAASTTRINLSWVDAANNETGFYLQRKTGASGTWATIATLGQNVISYQDSTGLTAATAYYYRISSYNSSGESAASNEANATTLTIAAPTNLKATVASTTQINLSWTDNSDNEANFRVSRRLSTATTWSTVATLAANTASYQDTGLTPSTTYVYAVVAVHPNGEIATSASVTATTSASALIAPTNLAATTYNSNQVDLSWTDNTSSETGYRILRRLTSSTSNTLELVTTIAANSTLYSVTGLNSSTGYTFAVAAVNAAGAVATSGTVTATTTANPMIAPTGLSAVAISGTQINLAWTDTSSDETGFRVLRRPNNSSSSSTTPWTIVTTTAANVTTYENTGLSAATSYTYAVASVNAIGDYAISAVANATTLSTALTAPGEFSAKAISDTRIDLTWTDTTTVETGYRVMRKLTSGSAALVTVATLAANATSYSDTGLTAATGYTYAVVAFDAAAKTASSKTVNVTTKAELILAPSALVATPFNSNQVDLTWTDNSSNEASFRIFRRPTLSTSSGTPEMTVVGTVPANTTSYSVTGLNPSTNYTFVVAAVGAFGTVAPSTPVAASTVANPMTAPTGFTATAFSNVQINLAWTDTTSDEVGFRILRRPASNGSSSSSNTPPWTVVTTTAANITSYEDAGLAAVTGYTYAVASVNAIGDYAISAVATAATLSTVLTAPSNFIAKAFSDTRIDLTWTDTTVAETGYRVTRKLTSGSAAPTTVATLAANATSYSDTGLTAATGYTYAVVAFDAAAKTASSKTVNVTTKAELVLAPSALVATPYNSNQVDLTWTDNSSNEASFRILRRLTSSTSAGTPEMTVVGTVPANTTSYSVTGLSPLTSYTFVVAAVGNFGTVAPSASVVASTVANPMIAPTGLTATAFSNVQINLAWTDTTTTEVGFRILRRLNATSPWTVVTTTAADVTSYEDTGLAAVTGYTYAVASVNAIGDYAISAVATAATLATALTAPGNLTAKAFSDTRIDLTWTDTTVAETGYRVTRKLTSSSAAPATVATLAANATSYSDTGLTAATGYTYAVVAADAAARTASSRTVNVTTKAEVVLAPSSLVATPYSSNQINLSWTDNSGNEARFRILRRLTSSSAFTEVATVPANSTTYSVTGLNPSTSYTFAVAAVGVFGTVATSTSVAASTTANPMIAPTGLTATAFSNVQINLAWTDTTTTEVGFRILRRLNATSPWTVVTTTAADVTTYENIGLTAATSYTYAVASVNALGDFAISAPVTVLTQSTQLTAPTNVVAKVISDTQINLTWTDTTAAETGYRISRRKSNVTTLTTVATIAANSTSYSDTGLTAVTGYVYVVTAIDAAGKTAPSVNATATTRARPAVAPAGAVAVQ
jgi:large repetitive protein